MVVGFARERGTAPTAPRDAPPTDGTTVARYDARLRLRVAPSSRSWQPAKLRFRTPDGGHRALPTARAKRAAAGCVLG